MSHEVVRMPAADSLRIRFSMTEDRVTVPLDGYTLRVLVMSDPQVDITVDGSGAYSYVTIPKNAIGTPGLYAAEISADNGAQRHTQPFKLRVDAHP